MTAAQELVVPFAVAVACDDALEEVGGGYTGCASGREEFACACG